MAPSAPAMSRVQRTGRSRCGRNLEAHAGGLSTQICRPRVDRHLRLEFAGAAAGRQHRLRDDRAHGATTTPLLRPGFMQRILPPFLGPGSQFKVYEWCYDATPGNPEDKHP